MTESTTMAPEATVCARCSVALAPGAGVAAGDRMFCRACHALLREQLASAITAMTTGIHWPGAIAGAVLGAFAGALVWWGFGAATHIEFGLVAIAIGWLAGTGAVRFSGGRRGPALQRLCVAATLPGFALGRYLLNATLINRDLAARGDPGRVPWLPANAAAAWLVTTAGFGVMDAVFLALALWQAWKLPRAPRLPDAPA